MLIPGKPTIGDVGTEKAYTNNLQILAHQYNNSVKCFSTGRQTTCIHKKRTTKHIRNTDRAFVRRVAAKSDFECKRHPTTIV